ncbi:MAG TPA: LON peptidase substrate-binding domain-containing protein [Acidimicrobiales bacterium]|nr:LON peptidase substrate-binding domain-containing protein [Acidimicrobiales bacterium]
MSDRSVPARETELPMFPLQSVLVPAAGLPLHVFEPRYRSLVRDVLARERPEFGVALIERGSEVGGGDERSKLGTVARIIDAREAPDGRWGVVARGVTRIDVVDWLPDDPYPKALVRERPEAEWTEAAGAAVAETEALVRRALALKAELGEAAPSALVELDEDPRSRSWQLVAVAPITTYDRQGLLAVDDPRDRASRLGALTAEELDVLACRLRGR